VLCQARSKLPQAPVDLRKMRLFARTTGYSQPPTKLSDKIVSVRGSACLLHRIKLLLTQSPSVPAPPRDSQWKRGTDITVGAPGPATRQIARDAASSNVCRRPVVQEMRPSERIAAAASHVCLCATRHPEQAEACALVRSEQHGSPAVVSRGSLHAMPCRTVSMPVPPGRKLSPPSREWQR